MVQKLPPVAIIRVISAFRTFLIRLNRKLFPGNVVLYEQFQYFWLLPSLYVAAKLDIATLLKSKPLSSEEIAGQLNADPVNLNRVMRALSSQGIFRLTRTGQYSLNSMARGLLEGPGSLRQMVLHHLGPINWNLMGHLEYSVRTGKDAFSEYYGKPVYDYLLEHPEEYAIFDKSMSNLSDLGLAPILAAYDFSGFGLIIDIGGGEGFLLANILQKHPSGKGILFDMPDALVKAPQTFTDHGVENRIELMSGNFFNIIPAGGNLYILKHIIHNWSDEKSVELLGMVYQSMPADAILLIIEMVVPEGNESSLSKLLDIQMMASMSGGKERTAVEYKVLLNKAGFSLNRIIRTIAPISLLEARKNG